MDFQTEFAPLQVPARVYTAVGLYLPVPAIAHGLNYTNKK